jgi:AAA ATPase domain
MCREHLRQHYGRNKDLIDLQQIFHEILKRGDGNSCKRCPDCSATVVTEGSSQPNVSNSSFRDDECSIIAENFSSLQEKSVDNDCRLILISGQNGIGKRTVVREALNGYRKSTRTCPHNMSFLYASGQCRTYQEDEDPSNPYTSGRSREFENSLLAFHDAIREMVDVLLQDVGTSRTVLDRLKSLLKDCRDIVILMEAFPCTKKLLSLEPTFQIVEVTPEVYFRLFLQGEPSAADRLHVLCCTLTLFIQAVSSCVPLVLVLEDLQRADASSMTLIEALLNHEAFCLESRSAHFLMVATYSTDSEEQILHSFQSFLHFEKNAMIENRIPIDLLGNIHPHKIHHLSLFHLSWDDMHEWTNNTGGFIRQLTTDQKRAVTDLVFHQTNGNPLHAQYLFQYLQEDNTLLSDPIHKKTVPRTLGALYASMLSRQDHSVMHLVRCTAVLSRSSETEVVDCDVLRVAIKKACGDDVLQAQKCCLLQFFPARGYIRFHSKELQVAAYKTIPDTDALHFAIGLSLWKDALLLHDRRKVTDEKLKKMLHRAISHLQNRMNFVSDFDERLQMSKFCYEFGLHSSQLGDFATSAKLFEFGIHVLGQDLWHSDLYETCLVLHNAAAQTYFYICKVDKMEQTLDAIFCNAQSFEDKIPAYIVLVYSKAKGQMKEGFRISSGVLSELGEPINAKPGTFSTIKTWFGMKCLLIGKGCDFLSNLPDANECNQIISHFLSFAMFFIYVVKPRTSFLLCSHLICTSIKNGITGPAAVAFAQHAYISSGQGRLDEGYRFCQLSLLFADRFEVWRPRIHLFVHGLTNFWTHPMRDSMDPLYRAQRDAIKFGDMQSYGFLAGTTIALLLKQGKPLPSLQIAAKLFCQSVAKVGQLSCLFLLLPHWSVINDLTGSQDTLNIPGEIQDSDTLLKFAAKEGAKVLLGCFYANRAMFHFLMGEYQQCLEMAKKVYENRKLMDFTVMFYEGLALSALSWELTSYKKRMNCLNECRKLARRMRILADRCPGNFRNKQLLMEAEIAALKGKSLYAIALYEESVSGAKNEGFVHEEGIAYQRLGQYHRHLGNSSSAKLSLEHARMAFDKWGANVVVDRMEMFLASITVE